MVRNRAWMLVLVVVGLGSSLGAAPAAPSFVGVEKAIAKIQSSWKDVSPDQNPNATAWNAYFDGLREQLRTYATATSAEQRVDALRVLHEKSKALGSMGWSPATELHEELRAWLRPRVTLAWAEYRVLEAVSDLPESEKETRDKWKAFIDDRLRPALRELEAAKEVGERLNAVDRVQELLDAIKKSNQARSWSKSVELQSALSDLYNPPNLEVLIDATAVRSAVLPKGIVEPGPIFFKGQWSYVTPGPITGVGFVPTEDGIAVSISQAMTSVTPIRGFQEQMAADPRGRRATNLYNFSATSQNNAILTMTALFRTSTGLQLAPSYLHGVSAAINSTPIPGKGFGRLVAGMLGFGQKRITDKVYEGAIPEIRQQVVEGSYELSAIKTSESAADLNAKIRPYVLDHQTVGNGPFAVSDLSLKTRSQYAQVRGNVVNLEGDGQHGAFAPKPCQFDGIPAGLTADVHLPSIIANLVNGFFQKPEVRDVTNLMIVTSKNPDNPAIPNVSVTRNVDFATFLAEVKKVRELNDPSVQVFRIFRPSRALRFGADAQGRLIVLTPEFLMEVPAPAQATRGGALTGPPAQVYRIKADRAEFAVTFTLKPGEGDAPPQLSGTVAGFDPGSVVQVFAINEEESNAVRLNAFTARIVTGALGANVSGRNFDVPLKVLEGVKIRLTSASSLDPTGWMRVVLSP